MSTVRDKPKRKASLTIACGAIVAIAGCSNLTDPAPSRSEARSEGIAAVLSMQLLVSTDSGVVAYPSTRQQVEISSSGVRKGLMESIPGATLTPGSAAASLLPRPQLHFSQSQGPQPRTHHLNSRRVWKQRVTGNDYALNVADDAGDSSGEPAHYLLVSTNGTLSRFFKLQYSKVHGRWAVAGGAAYDIDSTGRWSQAAFFSVSDHSVASARRSMLRSAVDALAVAGSMLLPATLDAQTVGVYSPLGCALDMLEMGMAAGSVVDAAAAALAYMDSLIACGSTVDGGVVPPGTPSLPTVYVTSTCYDIQLITDYYVNDMYVGSDSYWITVCS